jgi:heme-degrading monooxygenase HmoA
MILEIADFRIHPGQQAEFEAAIAQGIATVLSTSPGFISAKVERGIESPERYVLLIEWQALEDHTVGFRGGPLFPAWRAIVGPFFAAPPSVEHFELAVSR